MALSKSEVINRLNEYEGKIFYTKTSKEFIYHITGNEILIEKQRIYILIDDIVNVAGYSSLPPVLALRKAGFYGASYIWGILNDSRFK